MVRGGRAGLHAFFWLPGGFGDEVADTGLTRAMVAPDAWKQIEARDLGSSRGGWSDELAGVMAPELAGLVEYATTGNEATLRDAAQGRQGPRGPRRAAHRAAPIARGSAAEVQLVEAALEDAGAGGAARGGRGRRQRRAAPRRRLPGHPGPGADLAGRRAAPDRVRGGAQPRRARPRAVPRRAGAGPRPGGAPRAADRGLGGAADDAPSAGDAVSVLADARRVAAAARARQGAGPRRARQGPEAAATALTGLVAQERAPVEARVFAIDLLRDADPLPRVGQPGRGRARRLRLEVDGGGREATGDRQRLSSVHDAQTRRGAVSCHASTIATTWSVCAIDLLVLPET